MIPPSYTIIDGDFVSLFEYREGNDTYFTLTSVANTPLGQYQSSVDAENRMKTITAEEIKKKRELFEREVSHFIADFGEKYGMFATPVDMFNPFRVRFVFYFLQDQARLGLGQS